MISYTRDSKLDFKKLKTLVLKKHQKVSRRKSRMRLKIEMKQNIWQTTEPLRLSLQKKRKNSKQIYSIHIHKREYFNS